MMLSRRLAFSAAMLMLGACSNEITLTLPADPVSLRGLWDWTAQRVASGYTCHDSGSLRLEHSIYDSAFTGESRQAGSCTSPLGTFPSQSSDSVAGELSTGSARFSLKVPFAAQDRCTLTAATVLTSNDSVVLMSGT